MAAPPPRGRRTGYTLAHAGRQVRLGPVAFWTAVGTLVIMAGWTAVTASYFAFREDVLGGLVRRQEAMQTAYEDRIADLRAQIDRITSHQLLDQDQVEEKLNRIVRRQDLLESRASSLAGVAGSTVGGPGRHRTSSTGLGPRSEAHPKASPIDEAVPSGTPAQHAGLRLRTMPVAGTRNVARAKEIEATLAHLQASLDRVERSQTAVLDRMKIRYGSAARRMGSVLADLGVKAHRHVPSGVGGPFVPVEGTAFQQQLYETELARAEIAQMTERLQTVPVRQPIAGDDEVTSGFGVRIDPFLGRPAMHTGIDLRAPAGAPVHATAAGTVVSAGWSGGYGNMVEIDHGHGLTTRYGHLSKILVSPGQKVGIGEIVGRVGSTGRATGPHLHYETRVEDEPVDPSKFLQAGIHLSGFL